MGKTKRPAVPPDPDQLARDWFLAGRGCPQILKVSKHLKDDYRITPGEPCKCDCQGRTMFRVSYRSILKMRSVRPCDETAGEPLLQDGVELWLNATLTLRLDQCPDGDQRVLVGCNQGTFTVHRYRPNEDIFTGTFCGTEGFQPVAEGGKRCCAPGHGLGSLCGEGVGKLKDWSLCVTYHSVMHNLDPERLCEPGAIGVDMDVDGVLIGPCNRMDQ